MKRSTSFFMVGLSLSLTLVACGGGTSQEKPSATSTISQATTTPEPEATPTPVPVMTVDCPSLGGQREPADCAIGDALVAYVDENPAFQSAYGRGGVLVGYITNGAQNYYQATYALVMTDYITGAGNSRSSNLSCANPKLLAVATMIAERMKIRFGEYPVVSVLPEPELVAYPTIPALAC